MVNVPSTVSAQEDVRKDVASPLESDWDTFQKFLCLLDQWEISFAGYVFGARIFSEDLLKSKNVFGIVYFDDLNPFKTQNMMHKKHLILGNKERNNGNVKLYRLYCLRKTSTSYHYFMHNMEDNMEKVLEFVIELDEVFEVKGGAEKAIMILFHGFCECENFHGKILPGGVDTQIIYADQSKSLSARYILEGKDSTGCDCRIFVENQGIKRPDDLEFETKPFIITDSIALKWIEKADITGRIDTDQEKIIVRIYKK